MLKPALTALTMINLALASWASPGVRPVQDPIIAGYERFYQGDVEGAYGYFRGLQQREPENLPSAFGVLFTLTRRVESDESLQREFEERTDQLMRVAQARMDKNSGDRDAIFYLAQAYGERAAYRFNHDKGVWGAARDAAKSKKLSETYLRLESGRADAYLALGLYNYYVDIAPAFIKFFRIFLFLPSGNRGEGLKQLERTAREGQIFGPEAQQELSRIYAWTEGRIAEGLGLAQSLANKYPDNPDYQSGLASLYAHPMLEDYQRAAERYRSIIQRADQGHPHYQGGTRYGALLGLARTSQQTWRLDEAIAALGPTISASVTKPAWVLPRFLLTRGNLRALLNDANAAEDAKRVLGEGKWKTFHKSAERQLKWIEQRRQSSEPSVYVALIPGNRLVVERRWEEARQFYQRLLSQYPNDSQVLFRLAYLDFSRGELDPAARGLNQIVNSSGKIPDWVKANALLYVARIHDLQGQREQAMKLYKRIVDSYENESAAQAARLGLITPYQRRPARA